MKAAKNLHSLKHPEKIAGLALSNWKKLHARCRQQTRSGQSAQDCLVTRSHSFTCLPDRDTGASVRDWVSQLAPPLQDALILIYMAGLTHREAGEVIGCAEGTISWRISESLKTLRKIAEQETKSI